jgi:hypothetical protein
MAIYPPLDPFGGSTFNAAPPPVADEVKTLATLSIVFAFVFAPVGAVLGHLALYRIKLGQQHGRDRALIGLTLSYVIILFAIVALLFWALTPQRAAPPPAPAAVPAAPAQPHVQVPPATQTTVITPAPSTRRTVNVDELRTGDCVEIQQTKPDPNSTDTQLIKIYPVNCESRDGVFRVDVVSSSSNQCTDNYLTNRANTVVACISKFKG